jgi:hypothetical protein
MTTALSKLPNYANTIYRGAGAAESAAARTWQKGQVLPPAQKFWSCSKATAVADNFMKDGKGDVRYLIQGADGKDISPLSYFAPEKEVLPPTGQVFKVEDFRDVTLNNGKVIREIKLIRQ